MPGERRRRALGRFGIALLWIAGLTLTLAALAVLALAALVAHGPVEIATAARTAETLLAEAAGPDGRAKVGQARLDWSWEQGLTVALDEIVVDRAGVLAMSIPRAEIRLRPGPILLGEVRPRELVLFEPRLTVDTAGLAAAGAMVGAASPPGPAGAAAVPDTSMVAMPAVPGTASPVMLPSRPARVIAEAREIGRAVDRAVARARGEGIEVFGLRNGTIELRRTDHTGAVRTVTLPEVEAEAVVDGPAGDLDVGFSARGEVGRWSMRLTAAREADRRRRLVFVAEDVTHRDLFGPPGPAFDLGMPLYPRLTLHYGPDDGYAGAEIDLRLGAGEFRFGPQPEDSMLVDEGHVQIDWKAGAEAFEVRDLFVAVGETGMALHGRITPPVERDGPWAIALEAGGGNFRPRDVPGKPVVIDGGHLEARFDPVAKTFHISGAEATFGPGWVKAAGRIDLAGEPRMKLDLTFSPLDVDQVKLLWPHWVAMDTREWFIANVSGGRLFETEIHLDLPHFDRPEIWPGAAFRMAARFEDGRFRPLGNLPAIARATGRMIIDDRRMEVVADRAQVATKWAKRPTVEAFRFSVADIFTKPPKATIRFRTAGEVPALAEVIDAEPLALLEQAGVRNDGLAGTAAVTAQIDVTFDKPIRANSVDYRIEASLERFASPNPIQGRRFQDGRFKIVVDPRGLKITGRAQIDGVVTDVDMYDTRGAAKGTDKRDFKMVLDEAARQRVGLDLGDLVRGAIAVSVAQPSQSDPRRKVEVDLTPARLYLTPFGWSKGSGVPARATLDLVEDDKGVRLENLIVEVEGLTIAGSVVLDKDHHIVSADFTRFALRKGDSARLKLARGADNVLVVTFDAQNFDLRGLMQAGRRSGGEETDRPAPAKPTDLVLKLRAARIVGFNDVTLADASLDGRYRGGAFANLQFSARSSGGRSISAAIRPEGDRRAFTVNADDGGALLSFLDFFDRIRGGRLLLDARLAGPGVAQGRLRLDDFHLLEQPKSGRAAPQGTSDGVQQIKVRRVEINPQTDFSRSSVRFSMRDGVVTVTEGVAKGASVGATASGQIDLNSQRLSLSGTYIPAFGLNNLAGRIPVVGAITGAGSNEGLLGVTFRVFGVIEEPILEINPLSAIAPGIFRRIFEFHKDEQPAPAQTGNAPTRITP